MNALIGDIGNTITKVCLIETKTFKIKKIIYFDSRKIFLNNYLKTRLKKIHEIEVFANSFYLPISVLCH